MEVSIDLIRTAEDVGEFGRAMSKAFQDYPVMLRAFADYPDSRSEWIYRLASQSVSAKFVAGGPIPIARADGRVVGGANMLLPGLVIPPAQEAWFNRFLEDAGSTTRDFFPRFIGAVDSVALPGPHAHLLMIGVEPQFQGRGIGRRIIEKVVDLACACPGCEGVALDTEEAKNVEIYEACGFKVVGETSVDDMPIWVMWRSLAV